jgi:DNA-directed RNA polymerase subunit M/transcription elongation factor TFIIS
MEWLQPFVKSESNLKLLETYLRRSNDSEDKYLAACYETLGMLIAGAHAHTPTHEVVRSALGTINEHAWGWDHPMYRTCRALEEEQVDFEMNPFEVEEGVLECSRCHSKRTISFQRQTRSADEMATTFAQCVDCGKRWRHS